MSLCVNQRPELRRRPIASFLAEHRSEDRVWHHRNGRVAATYDADKQGYEKFESHYSDGSLHTIGFSKDNHPVGEWHTYGLGKHYVYVYDDNGNLIQSTCYKAKSKKLSAGTLKPKATLSSAGNKQKVRV